jgi:hypothetical protein
VNTTTIELDAQGLASVLFALRLLQSNLTEDAPRPRMPEYFDAEGLERPTADRIDALCLRINFGGLPQEIGEAEEGEDARWYRLSPNGWFEVRQGDMFGDELWLEPVPESWIGKPVGDRPVWRKGITARAHSDDYVFEVEFDAEPWFRRADDQDVLLLAAEGWGGNYKSDEVALDARDETGHEGLVRLFDYLELIRDLPSKKDACGFECHVDEDEALCWLREFRPDLWSRVPKEEDGLGH